MLVVIDTNVLVSSFLSNGPPRRIIELWRAGRIVLCLSEPILDEYVEVLERLGLKGSPELDELVGLFASGFSSILVPRPPSISIVREDPDDDKFVECAVALKAAFIVSGDKAVLKVKNYLIVTDFGERPSPHALFFWKTLSVHGLQIGDVF